MAKKKRRFWAVFPWGELGVELCHDPERYPGHRYYTPQIYLTRKEARRHHGRVREVIITEVNNGKAAGIIR